MPGVARASNGRRLATAKVTANQAVTAGAGITDITGMSITLTTPGVPWWVEMWIGWVGGAVATGNSTIWIADSANNEVARIWTPPIASGGVFGPVYVKRQLTPAIIAPGTALTLKGRVQVVSGATHTLQASADTFPGAGSSAGPSWLTAYTE